MSGNSFGQLFVVTTAGESHGLGMLGIVDGCPPGLALTASDIQHDVDRRKTAQSRYTSQRKEPDQVQLLSGVFEGKTTGTPIAILIANQDAKPKDYDKVKTCFRPGHGDYTYQKKYGYRDYRGGGRASARETVIRVAAGAIAKKYLTEQLNIHIQAYMAAIGSIQAEEIDLSNIDNNPFFFPDPHKITMIKHLIQGLLKEGNSIGSRLTVIASNVPVGLGEPVFHKLDADIAHAMMGINAVKGVSIGDGFAVVTQTGSEHRDEQHDAAFLSNHAGGTLAGISTGQPIIVHLAFKPTSSIRIPGKTIDLHEKNAEIITIGRHDPCVGVRAIPIVEAMMALVLMDHYLRDKAQNS